MRFVDRIEPVMTHFTRTYADEPHGEEPLYYRQRHAHISDVNGSIAEWSDEGYDCIRAEQEVISQQPGGKHGFKVFTSYITYLHLSKRK